VVIFLCESSLNLLKFINYDLKALESCFVWVLRDCINKGCFTLFRQVLLIVLLCLKVGPCYNNYCLKIVHSADNFVIIKEACTSLEHS
jgi:hypothetical protein